MARPLVVTAGEDKPELTSHGILRDDLLFIDPDQPGEDDDVVLVIGESGQLHVLGDLVGASIWIMSERPAGTPVVGPVVWIERWFAPTEPKRESAPLEPD